MIDEETERAVASWVRLADETAGKRPDQRSRCVRCGTTYRVLGRGEDALCAHCYLERGEVAVAAH
ncbi:MAG TPA: hypothetical protein VEU77_12880 [Candidatus Acidoferrales bacterium]|nr:hypothetical protein [Candidatus Acidoferrales bacterium]